MSATDGPPTRVRYRVLAFLCTVTLLLYLDRMCFGKAAPAIQRELELTDTQMGFIHAAFLVAYGLFEVVSGHWADQYGARRVLTRIVVWWSAFTALTGFANGFVMLLVVRFLFGAGEAGAFPNVTRIIELWFPASQRGWIRGMVHLPALLGGVVAPIATAWLMEWIGWRWTVQIYGGLGVIWAACFLYWFRETPAVHPEVNAAERELIGSSAASGHGAHQLPWGAILSNRNVWAIGGVMCCASSTLSIVFNWWATYLENIHGVSNIDSGWLNAGIMLGGALGCLIGGWASSWASVRISSLRWRQSAIGTTAMATASLCMMLAAVSTDYRLKTLFLALVCLAVHVHAAPWWTANSLISGRHVSAVFGLINSMGVLASAVAQPAFGWLPRDWWPWAFWPGAVILALAAVCWSLVDPRQTIVDPAEKPAPPTDALATAEYQFAEPPAWALETDSRFTETTAVPPQSTQDPAKRDSAN